MAAGNRSPLPDDVTRAVIEQVEAGAEETVSLLQEMIHFKTENPLLCDVEPGAEVNPSA